MFEKKFKVGDICRALGVSSKQVRRWIHNGELKVEVYERRYYIAEKDLYDFCARYGCGKYKFAIREAIRYRLSEIGYLNDMID